MRVVKLLVLSLGLLSLAGCAAVTPNFSVKQEFWNDKSKVVGIAVGDMPKPTAHKSGTQGLLDVLINDANASELETHLNSLNISKVNEVADRIAAYLKTKGLRVKRITKRIDKASLKAFQKENDDKSKVYYTSRDYRPLKKKFGVDKLVLIDIVRIGTIRDYYGFIPMGEPSGLSHLGGYVVNLDNNHLEWNQAVVQTVPQASAEWDSPPEFTGLTKAMYAAFDQSRVMLFNNFAQ